MKVKKKTICIVGMQYDMSVMDIDYVKQSVQDDLNHIYGLDKIKFEMSEDETGAYHLIFKRRYGDWYSHERTVFNDEKTVFAPDVHILLGTNRKEHPTEADLEALDNANVHYLSLADVEKDYQKASKARGSMKVKNLDVNDNDGEIEFIVGF